MISSKHSCVILWLVASVTLVLIIICIGVLFPKRKIITSIAAPIIIELLPNGRVNIVQARSKVSYTQREFNNLQHRLNACIELKPACKFDSGNQPGCKYTAHAYNLKLCLSRNKHIVNGTIENIVLHREDLLRIYEL